MTHCDIAYAIFRNCCSAFILRKSGVKALVALVPENSIGGNNTGPIASYLDIDFGCYVFLREALNQYVLSQIKLDITM